jgi:hypothetical protein
MKTQFRLSHSTDIVIPNVNFNFRLVSAHLEVKKHSPREEAYNGQTVTVTNKVCMDHVYIEQIGYARSIDYATFGL